MSANRGSAQGRARKRARRPGERSPEGDERRASPRLSLCPKKRRVARPKNLPQESVTTSLGIAEQGVSLVQLAVFGYAENCMKTQGVRGSSGFGNPRHRGFPEREAMDGHESENPGPEASDKDVRGWRASPRLSLCPKKRRVARPKNLPQESVTTSLGIAEQGVSLVQLAVFGVAENCMKTQGVRGSRTGARTPRYQALGGRIGLLPEALMIRSAALRRIRPLSASGLQPCPAPPASRNLARNPCPSAGGPCKPP